MKPLVPARSPSRLTVRKFFPLLLRGSALIGLALALDSGAPLIASDLDQAAAQFREYLAGGRAGRPAYIGLRGHTGGAPAPEQAVDYARALAADGSWAGIDYASTARSSWAPFRHVLRMTSMAAALHSPTLPAETREMLRAACDRAARFWMKSDYRCPNWWYNEIGVPQFFGEYAVLRGTDLPADERRYLVDTVLARSQLGRTGQNRVWLAGNVLMRSMVTGDETAATAAAAALWGEVAVSEQEGIQPDWSFHQHGPQQQFGNYGMGFAVEISRWMTILRGTRFALPAEKQGVFRSFLLEGVDWVSWRGTLDVAACGRQITPGSQRAKVRTFGSVFTCMETADPGFAAAYAAYVRRNRPDGANDLVGSRYFWRSDYYLQRQPGLFLSLKMSSARVIGTELVNSENLAGRHLADGALLACRRGDEYADIFPVWDWRHIPGTTCGWEAAPPRTGRDDDRLMTTWVGGLSDGRNGCAVLDYDRDGVRARKGWFFRDSRVVCLGNGISSDAPLPVHTSVNQCRLNGAATAEPRSGQPAELAPETRRLDDTRGIEHDGLRYRLLAPGAFSFSGGERRGRWSVVYQNPGTPPEELSLPVFDVWIDHGVRPRDASYAWLLAVSGDGAEDPVVVANTAVVQAVRWSADCAQAAFWRAGAVELFPGQDLEAQEPCLVMLERTAEGWRWSVSDPSQALKTVHLSLAGRSRTIDLPQGPLAGRTVTVP